MLRQSKLFVFSQLLRLDSPDDSSPDSNLIRRRDQFVDFAATRDGQALAMITKSGQILSLLKGVEGGGDFQSRRLPWYENDDLQPSCVTFSPFEDFALVCSRKGRLFILPSPVLVPKIEPFGVDPNSGSWSASSITEISPLDESFSPSSSIWWTTQESESVAVIGTLGGVLLAVDLSTEQLIARLEVCHEAIVQLETLTDSALDCTYLFLTTEKGTQFRLLLEQRSTGYFWRSLDTLSSSSSSFVPLSTIVTNEERPASKSTSEECLAVPRSRLSGLKQISAAGLASLRQRLSEGRKMLDRKMSSSLSSSSVELGTAKENIYGPLRLSSAVGDTKVSVQRSYTGETDILAGIYPDTSVMTKHNCELDVLPQSAYKLPRGTEKVLLMDKLVLTSTTDGQVQVVSTRHVEIHLESSSKSSDGIIQSFAFPEHEKILGMFRSNIIQQPLIRTSTGEEESATLFRKQIDAQVLKLGQLSQTAFGACLVITQESVYLLYMDDNPVKLFLELAMRGGDQSKAENLASAFGMDVRELYELAADIRLSEKDFSSAIALYRHASCKHLKVVLKFACSGFIQELLSYLTVLFKTPNLEATPGERIHLSNLALMAHFQQVLTKSTPTTRTKFQEQIKSFLDENQWFDESLSVKLASETREWDLLGHVSRSRGISFEMVDAIASTLLGNRNFSSENEEVTMDLKGVGKTVKDMSSMERNSLLACLLQRDNLEIVISDVRLSNTLLDLLMAILPLLESPGLSSVLEQCSPLNQGLWPSYMKCDDNSGIREKLVHVSLSAALSFVKKEHNSLLSSSTTSTTSDCDCSTQIKNKKKKKHFSSISEEVMKTAKLKIIVLAAGASHVVFVKKPGAVMSWGSAAHGILGHGATPSRHVPPKSIEFFKDPLVKVISVVCGKSHTLALTTFGVYAWGSSKFGQLGLGHQRCCEKRPFLVKSLCDKVIVAIAAGQYHSLALDSRGRLFSWGWGVHGQLGQGGIEDSFEPRLVRSIKGERVVQIGAGYAHSVVLTDKGEVFAFGCGLFGQLGNNDTKKSGVPLKVELLKERIREISCGYFHTIVISEAEELFVWGCNPQVLRFEAQQKKREKMQSLRKEMDMLQKQEQTTQGTQQSGGDEVAQTPLDDFPSQNANETIKADGQEDSPQVSGDIVAGLEEDAPLPHLMPTKLCSQFLDGEKIRSISCGNQHSLFLCASGKVFALGRNIDGQLGNNSRREAKTPVWVEALKDDVICHLACGSDFSVAVSETGTIFAWGGNTHGQLGVSPIDENTPGSDVGKVLVMKTTRGIIRLQNNLQNSCDVPKPVSGINNGVYADSRFTNDTSNKDYRQEVVRNKEWLKEFGELTSPRRFEKLLNLMLDKFHQHLDIAHWVKKCLVSDNLKAASKLSLISGNVLQAFEFSLQFSIKQNALNRDRDHYSISEGIFSNFLVYLKQTSGVEEQLVDQRRQLLERLIACWQDQKFNFRSLESLTLKSQDPLLMQTFVLTLFCPDDKKTENYRGPSLDEENGPKLVDLFTPEFCLRIGDQFVKDMKEERSKGLLVGKEVKEIAGKWLEKKLEE